MKNARRVLLIGNPNAGKTSLFNALTGEHRQVGNWPGVTVERLEGHLNRSGIEFSFLDLPGTYSLSPFTPEEKIAVDALQERKSDPDLVLLNVLDSTNLERNLVLTLQLLEAGFKPVLVLNIADELVRRGGRVDPGGLSRGLGCPVVTTDSRRGVGIDELYAAIIAHQSGSKPCELTRETVDGSGSQPAQPFREDAHDRNEDFACRQAAARFERIAEALAGNWTPPAPEAGSWNDRLDRLVTHRWLGLPLFFVLMALVFWSTFTLAAPISEFIEEFCIGVGDRLAGILPAGLLSDLVVNGVLAGVGGVLVFLPSVAILFLWIALLEDSGYMSRAAFLVDRLMQGLGLHGRAFLPLVMGFGCNVPAVMATRILDDPSQRLKTMLLIPMIGCSARLPVLVLLTGAFFPQHPGLWLFLVYIINFILMLLMGRIVLRFFPITGPAPFLLEMPPYRLPTLRSLVLTLREKIGHFLEKAATVILAGSILIWALNSFPREVPLSRPFDQDCAALAERLKVAPEAEAKAIRAEIEELNSLKQGEQMEKRWLASIGRLLEPIVRPFGCGWREGVALIPGFLAKESIISTLAVLYRPLSADLGLAMRKSGLTPLAGLAFMLFTLLYVPCLPTVGVIHRESGSLGFTFIAAFVPGVLAWIVSVAIFRIGMAVS